jgi:oligoribonuclease NrnB/cAMP/cGMP phosphodiesterase (DHH superfamily)
VEKTLSTARIVYEKFMKEDDISRKIAEYADDIDALTDKFDESFILRALSFKNGWKEKLIMKFSNGIFWDEEISREAEKVKRIAERDINEAYKKTKIYETKSGLKFGLIDLRGTETPKSWLAKRISEKFNLDFTIVWRKDYAISIYIGNKSKNINLLKIAEEFGGGGHPFACGFRIKLSWKSKIINYLTLKRKILKEVEDVVKKTIELM